VREGARAVLLERRGCPLLGRLHLSTPADDSNAALRVAIDRDILHHELEVRDRSIRVAKLLVTHNRRSILVLGVEEEDIITAVEESRRPAPPRLISSLPLARGLVGMVDHDERAADPDGNTCEHCEHGPDVARVLVQLEYPSSERVDDDNVVTGAGVDQELLR